MEKNNKWEEIKQKKTKLLDQELKIFVGKLEKVRGNRISLEAIRGLNMDYQGEKKPIKSVANLRITPNHELVIRAFEPKTIPLITQAILAQQLGYKVERSSKEEVCLTLLPITKEIKEKLGREVKSITEEGKAALRRVRQEIRDLIKKNDFSKDQQRNYEAQTDKTIKDYQDKLVAAEEKKIHELNS